VCVLINKNKNKINNLKDEMTFCDDCLLFGAVVIVIVW